MKRRLIPAICIAALITVLPLGAAAHANGAKDPAAAKEKQKSITGTIQAVSPSTGTFVLVSKGKVHEFHVAPRALVVINSKLAKLSDIKKGAGAEVVYTLDRETKVETAHRIFATQTAGSGHGKQETIPGRW